MKGAVPVPGTRRELTRWFTAAVVSLATVPVWLFVLPRGVQQTRVALAGWALCTALAGIGTWMNRRAVGYALRDGLLWGLVGQIVRLALVLVALLVGRSRLAEESLVVLVAVMVTTYFIFMSLEVWNLQSRAAGFPSAPRKEEDSRTSWQPKQP